MNSLRSLFTIVIIFLLGYWLYHLAIQNADNSAKTLHVSPDSTVTLVGEVMKNDTSCVNEGSNSRCFLRVHITGEDVYVIYNTNDNSFCRNEAAAAIGRNISEGAAIKVYGYYQKDGDLNTVLTCPTSDYFIQEL